MKPAHKLLYLFILLFLVSASCQLPFVRQPSSANPSGAKSGASTPVATVVTGQSTIPDDGSQARIVKNAPAPAVLKLPDLGKIQFQVDPSNNAVADYPGDGREVRMYLTDKAGLTWTLILPGNALDRPQTIQMIALANLQAGAFPAQIKGGVLLEPDGLTFFNPPILTVSGAGLGDKPILFTGQQDGSAVTLAVPNPDEPSGGSASARLYHFSSAFGGDAGQDLADFMSAEEKALIEAAKQLIKNKNISVPEPPSIPLECSEQNKEGQDADAFNKAVRSPEDELIRRMLALLRAKELMGQEDNQLMPLIMQLLKRLEKKAHLLIQTYNNQPEKLLPVGKVALSIAKDIQLLGGDTTILEEVGAYCSKSIDKLISDVRDKHDFRKINAVWLVARWAALLGSDNHSVDEIQSKLQAALHFKFKATFTQRFPEQEWQTQSELDLPYDANITDKGESWQGSGPGVYLGYTGAASVPMEAQDFTVTVTITQFHVCEGTAKLSVDHMSSASENYKVDDELQVDLPLVHNGFLALFQNYAGEMGYTLPGTIHNGSANVIEETISGNAAGAQGKVTGDLEIQVEHTPGQ